MYVRLVSHLSEGYAGVLGFLSKSLQFKKRKEEAMEGMEAVGEWPFQRRHFAPVEGTATPRSCQTLPLKVISNLWQLLEKRRRIPS